MRKTWGKAVGTTWYTWMGNYPQATHKPVHNWRPAIAGVGNILGFAHITPAQYPQLFTDNWHQLTETIKRFYTVSTPPITTTTTYISKKEEKGRRRSAL